MTKEDQFTLSNNDDEDEQDAWDGEDAAWTNGLDELEGEPEDDVKDESAAYLDFLHEEVSCSYYSKHILHPLTRFHLGPEVHS